MDHPEAPCTQFFKEIKINTMRLVLPSGLDCRGQEQNSISEFINFHIILVIMMIKEVEDNMRQMVSTFKKIIQETSNSKT